MQLRIAIETRIKRAGNVSDGRFAVAYVAGSLHQLIRVAIFMEKTLDSRLE
jgi:hypothetical protein